MCPFSLLSEHALLAGADGWVDLCHPSSGPPVAGLAMCAPSSTQTSEIGFGTNWKPNAAPADSDNLGAYNGETEEYDCDDIGVVRGVTKAHTSPACLRTETFRDDFSKACVNVGTVDVQDITAAFWTALDDLSFETMAKVCTGGGGYWTLIGPLKHDGTVCGDACTEEDRQIASAAACTLAVRRYEASQPVAWADDIWASEYGDVDVCLNAAGDEQRTCGTAGAVTYEANKHCYAIPTTAPGGDLMTPALAPPPAGAMPNGRGFSSYTLNTGGDCMSHWPGYPYAKQVPAGPHSMDCPPKIWPKSPWTVVNCDPRAKNGPDHLGCGALAGPRRLAVLCHRRP